MQHGRLLDAFANILRKYNPDQPRVPAGSPEGGQFGEGGGGGGEAKHPGKGYSKGAYVKGGVIYTKNVADAQRALYENRNVELDQPKKVSTLIKRLGNEAAKWEKEGKKAPTFDLCRVSVSGTNLFCGESKGIPRVEMPQVARKETKDFLKYLKKEGYGVEKGKEFAADLRATQNQLDGAKVAGIIKDKLRPNPDAPIKRLVVSKDNYILDGHHHWAAKLGMDAADGNLRNDAKMRVARVNISITKLLKEADKYTGGKGKVGVGKAELWEIFNIDDVAEEWGIDDGPHAHFVETLNDLYDEIKKAPGPI